MTLHRSMAGWGSLLLLFPTTFFTVADAHSGGPGPITHGSYRVLEPIRSGQLTIFPVTRAQDDGKATHWDYLTLDDGLKSGEVEITEAGTTRGMVRPRPGETFDPPRRSNDQVNTLVLINHSKKPLLLLAGEIVTGGKQDRIIGKDRIVPPKSDPLDLSVFCIEPGRWVASSETFAGASKGGTQSFMAQPSVRSQAMVAEDQEGVWSAVRGSLGAMANAAPQPLGTTSYAKAVEGKSVRTRVDGIAAPLADNREILEKLREQHAVGVVAAVNGRIVWADIFANPEMLAAYWTKLVRSYAAESLTVHANSKLTLTASEAQRFLDVPTAGHESSEGETGVYLYREIRGNDRSTFLLQALLPGTGFYVHTSRAADAEADRANAQ